MTTREGLTAGADEGRDGPEEAVGLVLAAGGGRRLGGLPKAMLADRAGESLLRTTVDRLRAGGCSRVVVVLGAAPEAGRLVAGDGVTVVVAPDWEEGIGASLRRGLLALDRLEAPGGERASPASVVITLSDLPDVGAGVVRRVLEAWRSRGARADDLVRAVFAARPGHPVLIGRDHWQPLLGAAGGDSGAQPYLRGRKVHEVDCDDLATGRDLDRPEDLATWSGR